MKKRLKINRQNYDTVFSFKINGTMAEPIIPTPPPPQPHPPLFPPLNPFPSGPDYPGYPGYPPSPIGPITPIEDYAGVRPWKKLVYTYSRSYGWNPWTHNTGWYYGADAVARFNAFKEGGGWGMADTDGSRIPCSHSLSIDDGKVEETELGYYPVDEPLPPGIDRSVYIASFQQYTCVELIDQGETGLSGYLYPTVVKRFEAFRLSFTGETIYG